MQQTFTEAVGAVSPLNGAIDGSVREKPRKPRKPPREPMGRSLTFFCSNPQCEHATWSPQDQARHMAREFWEVAQALVRVAPDSSEALKLTGGVILRELTDDECRAAWAEYKEAVKLGDDAPVHVRLRINEYHLRSKTGSLEKLSPEERGRRRSARHDRTRADVASLTDDEVRHANNERRRLRVAGLPVPDDIRRAAREWELRCERGILARIPLGERGARVRQTIRAPREAALPPVAERRTRRLALGLSAPEFAARIGAHPDSILDWERGGVPRSLEVLNAYAQLLSTASPAAVAAAAHIGEPAYRQQTWPPEAVKALRAGLGLTQRQFGGLVGVGGPAISTWESGAVIPPVKAIQRLNALVASGSTQMAE